MPDQCPICNNYISGRGLRGSQGVDENGDPLPFWTEDPLLTPLGLAGSTYKGITPVRWVHIKELQDYYNEVESSLGLTPTTFLSISKGEPVRWSHITQLRTVIESILTEKGMTLADYFKYDRLGNDTGSTQTNWTEPSLDKKTPIRAVHIEELRRGIAVLEWVEYFSTTPSTPDKWYYMWSGNFGNSKVGEDGNYIGYIVRTLYVKLDPLSHGGGIDYYSGNFLANQTSLLYPNPSGWKQSWGFRQNALGYGTWTGYTNSVPVLGYTADYTDCYLSFEKTDKESNPKNLILQNDVSAQSTLGYGVDAACGGDINYDFRHGTFRVHYTGKLIVTYSRSWSLIGIANINDVKEAQIYVPFYKSDGTFITSITTPLGIGTEVEVKVPFTYMYTLGGEEYGYLNLIDFYVYTYVRTLTGAYKKIIHSFKIHEPVTIIREVT